MPKNNKYTVIVNQIRQHDQQIKTSLTFNGKLVNVDKARKKCLTGFRPQAATNIS